MSQKALFDISEVKGPFTLLAALLIVLESLVGFWFFQAECMTERIICGSLMALLFIAFMIVVIRIAKPAKEVSKTAAPEGPSTKVTVEFCAKKDDVEEKIVDLLKNTKSSLHYYGGAGFIGTSKEWRKEFKNKLEAGEIEVTRLIDLKTAEELTENVIDTESNDVGEYIAWLRTHAENLESAKRDNIFICFEGAPIWKYAINLMIFDKEHVVIAFLVKGKRSALFIHNCGDFAKALTEHIRWIKTIFDITSMKAEQLSEIADKIEQDYKVEDITMPP